MKRIKTIIEPRTNTSTFDFRVNKALSEGWVLVRRYISNGRTAGPNEPSVHYPVLVAELEKEVPDAE
jgi:hypothetical protein